MKTIGGFIPIDDFAGKEYHTTPFRFNLCRNACLYAVLKHSYTKIHLPYFLCDSLTNVLDQYRVPYSFYSLGLDLKPPVDLKVNDNEAVLIVNYLGILTSDDVRYYNRIYGNLIIDHTQAFYARPESDIQADYIYSCRKWFGVPDGAYLYTNLPIDGYLDLNMDRSAGRMTHLLQKYEDPEEDYYDIYSQVEEKLDAVPVLRMSKLTQNVLQAVDYASCAENRRRNYAVLSKYLDSINHWHLEPQSVPFLYPLHNRQAVAIRQKLKEHRCFTPTLWPNVMKLDPNMLEYQYTTNTVYIPCDQRYAPDDMERVARFILEKYQ